MKIKKVLAGFMAAVVSAATLMAGSVTASAAKYPGAKYADESLYVNGYWDNYKNDTFYFLIVGNFGLQEWTDLYSGKNSELESLTVRMLIEDTNQDWTEIQYCAVPDPTNESGNIFGIQMCNPFVETNDGILDKSEVPYSFYYYNDSMTNVGFAILISQNSPLLNTLASCDEVGLVIHGIGTVNGEPLSKKDGMLKVKTDFEGLDDYVSTNISTLKFGKLSSKAYTGKAIKPSITVKDGDKKLVKGTDYTVSYKNNTKIGTATVIVTGKGKYSGTKELTFNIVPKKTKISIDEVSKSKAVINWKQSKGADGYEIWCSTNGESYTKLSTIKSAKTLTKTITKLNTQKNVYKFRVRPYSKVNGKTVYGSWSNIVSAG